MGSIASDKQMCIRADHLTNCALQLASCGMSTDSVFQLLSDLALEALRTNVSKANSADNGDNQGMALARTISATVCRLASAGVNDVTRFRKFADIYFSQFPSSKIAHTKSTEINGNISNMCPAEEVQEGQGHAACDSKMPTKNAHCDSSGCAESVSEEEKAQFQSDLHVLHSMRDGTFGTFSTQAMQVCLVQCTSLAHGRIKLGTWVLQMI